VLVRDVVVAGGWSVALDDAYVSTCLRDKRGIQFLLTLSIRVLE